jgi:hypothetical protein
MPQGEHASGASFHDVTPVELAYDAYTAPSGNKTDGALVVLHGFLCVPASQTLIFMLTRVRGSKRN